MGSIPITRSSAFSSFHVANLLTVRILHVLPHIDGGGVAEDTLGLIQFLQNNNVGVSVASSGGRLESALADLGIMHHKLPLQRKLPGRLWQNSYALQRLCRAHHIDLVHVHSRAPAWSCFLLAKRTGTPWVTTFHGIYGGHSWIKRLYNSVMARSSAVIAISSFVHAHIQRTYRQCRWFEKEKVFTVPRTIDGDFFQPLPEGKSAANMLRKRYGIDVHQRVLLLPGRFSSVKGHALLLEALASLKDAAKKFYVLFLGMPAHHSKREAVYIARLKQRAQQLSLERTIAFLPYQDDLRLHYMLADVCVLPTRKPEGFGRVLGESLAMETPVLTFAHGAAPEVVPHTAGILVPPSVEGLKQGLERVLTWGPETKKEHGAKGRAHILRHFNEAKTHHRMLGIYQALIPPDKSVAH